MASASETHKSLCGKMGLKPLTCSNVFYYYAPIQACASYTALSVNVMNPFLMSRLFPKRDVTNILLFNTIAGFGLYLYTKPHLQKLTKKDRIIYSAFGAVMFSLGSVLTWAILRSVLSGNVPVCTAAGIGSGVALLKVARNYTEHVDSLVAKP